MHFYSNFTQFFLSQHIHCRRDSLLLALGVWHCCCCLLIFALLENQLCGDAVRTRTRAHGPHTTGCVSTNKSIDGNNNGTRTTIYNVVLHFPLSQFVLQFAAAENGTHLYIQIIVTNMTAIHDWIVIVKARRDSTKRTKVSISIQLIRRRIDVWLLVHSFVPGNVDFQLWGLWNLMTTFSIHF